MTINNRQLEQMLKGLELAVEAGREALNERNRLLAEMSALGYTNTDLFVLLNRTRIDNNLKPLTRYAIDKVVARHKPTQTH